MDSGVTVGCHTLNRVAILGQMFVPFTGASQRNSWLWHVGIDVADVFFSKPT